MASDNAEGSSNIPQWKRDLIQRRRQQQIKINVHNGVKMPSGFGSNGGLSTSDNNQSLNSNSSGNNQANEATTTTATTTTTTTMRGKLVDVRGDNDGGQVAAAVELIARGNTGGATGAGDTFASANREPSCGHDSLSGAAATALPTSSVAFNMRLEADASLCPTSEEPRKFTAKNNNHLIHNSEHPTTTKMSHELFDNDNSRGFNNTKKLPVKNINDDNRDMASMMVMGNKNNDICVYAEFRKKNNNKILSDGNNKIMSINGKLIDECESDSSEELQYGPGIVNRLKSKYLNLTLREMNKTRVSVQRFRRAASLEDLLDCNDDGSGGGGGDDDDDDDREPEKINRKFMKKTMAAGVAAKTERYRNATRGNESIKRARSVETLMRYQTSIDDVKTFNSTAATTLISKKQHNNDTNDDHIVLIDRTAVKIESRLTDCEQLNNQRPIALNKPKRLKPLLAETERPPLDLVKTTMKIFEGSVKKLKPKGDVAIKVATFKTINDTFKAQTMKKCIPKPPIQPKPFVNGVSGKLTSPKKIVLMPTSKCVADAIEKIDNIDEDIKKKNDCVVTETIVQSVSSVVNKFQQIEKSQSPEPNLFHKYKYSPTPSPEPPSTSSSSSPSIINKQKAIVDIGNIKSPPLTPKILSPLIPSPKKDILQLHSCEINSICELNNENTDELDTKVSINVDNVIESNSMRNEMKVDSEVGKKMTSDSDNDNNDELKIDIETVDSPRTVSKLALDNISKAGSSIKFNFDGDSCAKKNYLPGFKSNCESTTAPAITNGVIDNNISSVENDLLIDDTSKEVMNRINSRLVKKESEAPIENDCVTISPGALIKLSSAHSNETKIQIQTVKNTKLDTVTMPQKQIGIIRPLVTTKTQQIAQQQNLSNRELEKNLINRVKSIEQPTKVVVSMKNAEEIKPVVKKISGDESGGGGGSGGLWDTKPWNQQNNTMVFNFSNRKDVPDYIENDGLIIRRKREKPNVGDGGVIVLDATLDASTTDDSDWEMSGGPPSPCDVSFLNDNILINGRSNLSKSPRNHKHRIQFDDTATRTFEYPSEASMLEGEGTSVDGETSASGIEQQQQQQSSMQLSAIGNKSNVTNTTSPILGGGGLSSYTPSKVELVSEGFELGITRALTSTPTLTTATTAEEPQQQQKISQQLTLNDETDDNNSTKSVQDTGAWGVEATADLLY